MTRHPALRLVDESARTFAHDPARRGYHVAYRGAETRCPGCGRSHWWVGRILAECGFCGTALPIEREVGRA